jgi:hypothetical protein
MQHALREVMNAVEAKAYGRKVKRNARALVEMGDCGTIVLNADWQLGDKSYKLGIVGADGVINAHGEVARAFREGFTGKTR